MKKLIFLILFLLSASYLRAEIKIKSFNYVRGDQTAIYHPVLGTNGQFCALVKVKTSVQGIMAEALQMRETPKDAKRSQTLVRIEQPCAEHRDELWLYFTTETKRFRLMHPDYGFLNEGPNISNGYFLPQWEMLEGNTFVMEIELTENTLPQGAGGTLAMPSLPVMCEVTTESDDSWMKLKIDNARVKRGSTILVPEGEHTFKEGRLLNPKRKQTFDVNSTEPLTLKAHASELPVSLFAGFEAAKPTSQADMGYGARLGIVGRWGAYGSFVKTWGDNGSFKPLLKESFIYDPVFTYSDPEVSYQSFVGGIIVRCYSCIHLYAGAGAGSRKVSWLKDDGQRYEVTDESQSGLTYEAGALINFYRLYISGGAERLGDNWVGHLGFGIYLTK